MTRNDILIKISPLRHYLIDSIKLILVLFLFVWMGFTINKRIVNENKESNVEICLDYDEVINLCQRNGYDVSEFFKRSRAIGVTSVAINEETMSDLALKGKIIYFPNEEFLRLRLLDLISNQGMVKANSIAVSEENLQNQIGQQLVIRYGLGVRKVRAGKYLMIYPEFPSNKAPYYWNDNMALGFSIETSEFLGQMDLKIVLNPKNSGDPKWLFETDLPENISGFMWLSREVSGYSGKEKLLIEKLRENKFKFINLEFQSVMGLSEIKNAIPDQLIQGHVISVNEIDHNRSAEFWLSRWRRAVKERSIRFMLFHFWMNQTIEENLSYLRKVAQSIKGEGLKLGISVPPLLPSKGNPQLWLTFALLAAVIFPVSALYLGTFKSKPILSYFYINTTTLAGGLLISALLYDIVFLQKIINIPGIKILMILPMMFSVFVLYQPLTLKKAYLSKIQVKHVFIAGFILLFAAIIFIRSGNHSSGWFYPDLGIRQFLENTLSVRPRTKEFIFGQPLLLLGLFYKRPYLIWLGMVGQVSIINTFLHIHTPVTISMLRTFHGIWLGLLLGCIAIGVIELVKSKKNMKV